MKKLVYEKPMMLVENFVATQSVALNCEGFTSAPVELKIGDPGCSKGDTGHKISVIPVGDINNDGRITLFNAGNGCDMIYESYSSAAAVGDALIGNGSWNSTKHAMVIGGVQIAS